MSHHAHGICGGFRGMSAPVFSGGGRRNAAVGAREACMESAEKGAAGGGKRAHEAGEEVPRTERRAKVRREVLSRRGRRDGMQGRGRKRADHGKKARSAPGRESFPGGNAGARPGALRRSAPAASGKVRGTCRVEGFRENARSVPCRALREFAGRDAGRPGEISGGLRGGSGQRLRQGRRPLSASGTGEGRTGERLALRRQ